MKEAKQRNITLFPLMGVSIFIFWACNSVVENLKAVWNLDLNLDLKVWLSEVCFVIFFQGINHFTDINMLM
jgi:hypothetical protein